jgi:hypothetical protein
MIEWILIVSGALALIALLWRGSVVIGLILGILPGIILGLAPGVFAYMASFAAIRYLLALQPPGADSAVAAMLTLALGCLAAVPSAVRGGRLYAAALKEDIIPSEPVEIGGHVLVTGSSPGAARHPTLGYVPHCTGLCLALLDTPGVLSVTLRDTDWQGTQEITYRLLDKDQAPTSNVLPVQPEQIFEHLPEPRSLERGIEAARKTAAERVNRRNAYAAQWASRLADRQSIVGSPARSEFDQVISIEHRRGDGPARIRLAELEIRRSGQILFRRQEVAASPVAVPLFPVPRGSGDMRLEWDFARRLLRKGPRFPELRPVALLFQHSRIARPDAAVQDDAPPLHEILARALRDPLRPAGDDAFKVVRLWFRTLDWRRLGVEELALLDQVIRDRRVGSLEGLYDGDRKDPSSALRGAIADRLLDHGARHEVRWILDELVKNMPPGTYRELTEDEKTIVRQQELRLKVTGIVERFADQGPDCVPVLMNILRVDAQVQPWKDRQKIMQAVRRAFLKLGPNAEAALPLVRELFESRPSPIMHSAREVQEWQAAMLLMGLPRSELPYWPSHDEDQRARELARVQRIVERVQEGCFEAD